MEKAFTFDRDKLNLEIKQYEANPSSPESIKWMSEEFERCKDPRYFFNAYWQIDGKPVDPMSEEDWNAYMNWQQKSRFKRARR